MTLALSRVLAYLDHLFPISFRPRAVAVPDRRRAYGKGTGRPTYAAVQRQRAANRRARAARRITRRASR